MRKLLVAHSIGHENCHLNSLDSVQKAGELLTCQEQTNRGVLELVRLKEHYSIPSRP